MGQEQETIEVIVTSSLVGPMGSFLKSTRPQSVPVEVVEKYSDRFEAPVEEEDSEGAADETNEEE